MKLHLTIEPRSDEMSGENELLFCMSPGKNKPPSDMSSGEHAISDIMPSGENEHPSYMALAKNESLSAYAMPSGENERSSNMLSGENKHTDMPSGENEHSNILSGGPFCDPTSDMPSGENEHSDMLSGGNKHPFYDPTSDMPSGENEHSSAMPNKPPFYNSPDLPSGENKLPFATLLMKSEVLSRQNEPFFVVLSGEDEFPSDMPSGENELSPSGEDELHSDVLAPTEENKPSDVPLAESPSGENRPPFDVPSGEDKPPSDVPSGEDEPPSDVPSGEDKPPSDVPSGEDKSPSDVPSGEDEPPSNVPLGEDELPSDVPSGEDEPPSDVDNDREKNKKNTQNGRDEWWFVHCILSLGLIFLCWMFFDSERGTGFIWWMVLAATGFIVISWVYDTFAVLSSFIFHQSTESSWMSRSLKYHPCVIGLLVMILFISFMYPTPMAIYQAQPIHSEIKSICKLDEIPTHQCFQPLDTKTNFCPVMNLQSTPAMIFRFAQLLPAFTDIILPSRVSAIHLRPFSKLNALVPAVKVLKPLQMELVPFIISSVIMVFTSPVGIFLLIASLWCLKKLKQLQEKMTNSIYACVALINANRLFPKFRCGVVDMANLELDNHPPPNSSLVPRPIDNKQGPDDHEPVSGKQKAAHSSEPINRKQKAAHSSEAISRKQKAAHSSEAISRKQKAAHSSEAISRKQKAAHSSPDGTLVHCNLDYGVRDKGETVSNDERLIDSSLDNDCDVEDKEETVTSSSNQGDTLVGSNPDNDHEDNEVKEETITSSPDGETLVDSSQDNNREDIEETVTSSPDGKTLVDPSSDNDSNDDEVQIRSSPDGEILVDSSQDDDCKDVKDKEETAPDGETLVDSNPDNNKKEVDGKEEGATSLSPDDEIKMVNNQEFSRADDSKPHEQEGHDKVSSANQILQNCAKSSEVCDSKSLSPGETPSWVGITRPSTLNWKRDLGPLSNGDKTNIRSQIGNTSIKDSGFHSDKAQERDETVALGSGSTDSQQLEIVLTPQPESYEHEDQTLEAIMFDRGGGGSAESTTDEEMVNGAKEQFPLGDANPPAIVHPPFVNAIPVTHFECTVYSQYSHDVVINHQTLSSLNASITLEYEGVVREKDERDFTFYSLDIDRDVVIPVEADNG